uniref:PPPDE domain-containing protein n=1 Tax=Strombidinopsis acuminata TaxID=141414 RepID=A0A7S3WPE3_9SPIT
MNSVSLDLLGIGGALHVGVEVLGNEWSFGMQGVSVTTPKNNQYYAYRQTVQMGKTRLARKEVISAILAMQGEWGGKEYDLFSRNCGTFCNALCLRLGVGAMPAWVTRLAETMGKLPAMKTIAGAISRATASGEDFTPGRNPFPNLGLEDVDEERPWADEQVCTPQNSRGARPGAGGFRLPAHPVLVAGSPIRASPVRCRFSGSPGLRGQGLPQKRCEGFRIDGGQSHAVPGASVAHGHPSLPVDCAMDKYGTAAPSRRRVLARGGG